ncbi:MAG: hypothetical protein ACREHV_17180 [Rhizomicrobium sp.]
MSYLNFSISARRPAERPRAYNPRGNVAALRSRSIVSTVVLVAMVMSIVFAMVWFA